MLNFFFHSVEDEPKVHNIYWRTEQKCRKFTKIVSYANLSNGIVLFSIINSLYDIVMGRYDTSIWILPFFLSVPFNTNTIWGWCLLLFINIYIGFAYTLVMTTITSYFISCCLYVSAVCKHFNMIIESVENEVKLNKHEKNFFKYKKRELKIKEYLCKAMNIHVKVYE